MYTNLNDFFHFNEQSILGYDSLQLSNILEEVSFIIDLIVLTIRCMYVCVCLCVNMYVSVCIFILLQNYSCAINVSFGIWRFYSYHYVSRDISIVIVLLITHKHMTHGNLKTIFSGQCTMNWSISPITINEIRT